VLLPLEWPQLVDTIRAHGDELYAESCKDLGEIIELGQLGDTVSTDNRDKTLAERVALGDPKDGILCHLHRAWEKSERSNPS
jgi:hypothetical protein